jgi:hypothetical protein
MPNVIDYTDEYLYWDQTEAVTIRLGTAAFDKNRAIDTAKRLNAAERESLFSDVGITSEDVVFLIPHALLNAGDRITIGDTIIDSEDVAYRVRAVTVARKGVSRSHYRCLVTEER